MKNTFFYLARRRFLLISLSASAEMQATTDTPQGKMNRQRPSPSCKKIN